MDKDTRDMLIALKAKGSTVKELAAQARAYAFVFQKITDAAVSIPAWNAGYEKALAAGLSDADAVFYADRVVRTAVQSDDVVDSAAIERGNAFVRLFTMFYSYMNMIWNRNHVAWLRYREGDISLLEFGAAHIMNNILPNLIAAAMVDALGGGGKQADDDDWYYWYLMRVASGYWGTVAIGRDVVQVGVNKLMGSRLGNSITNPAFSAAEKAVDGGAGIVKAMFNVARGKDVDWSKVTDGTLTGIGYGLNVPVGFIKQPFITMVDWLEGDTKPQAPYAPQLLGGAKPKN